MGPNDAQIVRVFSREPGGDIADVTLDPQKDGEIVVEAEAGHTLFGMRAAYRVTLVVRDITDGSAVPVQGIAEVDGQFKDAKWSTAAVRFKFELSSAALLQHAGHLAQAYGSVLYGSDEPGASFAVSPTFMILPQL